MVQISQTRALTGKGLAIGGIVAGVVGGLLNALLFVGFWWAGNQAPIVASQLVQESQMRQLAIAAHTYAAGEGGYFPPHPAVLHEDDYIPDGLFLRPGARGPLPPPDTEAPSEVVYRYGDIIWLYGGTVKTDLFGNNIGIMAIALPVANSSSYAVLFGDGTVERVERAELEAILRAERQKREQEDYAPTFEVEKVLDLLDQPVSDL